MAALSVSVRSSRKKEAEDFVVYICGREGTEVFARAGNIPAFRDAKAANANSILDRVHADIMRETLSIRDGLNEMKEKMAHIQEKEQ